MENYHYFCIFIVNITQSMGNKILSGILTGLVLLGAVMSKNLLQAQPQWNIAVQGGLGTVVNTFVGYDEMLASSRYPIADVRIGYQTTENDHPYAELYGYPNVGFSFGWMGLSALHYNGESHLGSVINLSGFFEGDLLRTKRFSIGYDGQAGFGLSNAIYDPNFNPLNTAVSSPLLIFVRASLKAKYRFTKQFEVGAGIHIEHCSTGYLSCPNLGLNGNGATLSLRYYTMAPPSRKKFQPERWSETCHVFGEVYFGGGLHRSLTEWEVFGTNTPWPILTAGGNINYRYFPHISTGLNLDFYHTDRAYLQRVEQFERTLFGDEAVDEYGHYDAFSCGLSFLLQFHYGNVTAFGNLGVYLHKHAGLHDQEGSLYQRAGIKFNFPKLEGLFVAVDCKAHQFTHASMIEFTVGKRI